MIGDALAVTARFLSGASVRWEGCQPSAARRVYIANHASHFDFVVLWSAIPRRFRKHTRAVAARDYWEGGRVRRFLARKVFHVVLIDRQRVEGRPGAVEVMLEAMRGGSSLIVFPEGTRAGLAEGPGEFRAGIYNVATADPGVEFVPVFIGNMRRILPKGEFLPVPLLSSITFGAPFRLEPGEERDAFLERARQAVARLGER